MKATLDTGDTLSVSSASEHICSITNSSALFCVDDGFVKVIFDDDTLTVELCPYIFGKQGEATVLSVKGESERQRAENNYDPREI